ncbi:MAG: YhfC family glutamic-type intramembrane protease [Anaerolineae bacterium]
MSTTVVALVVLEIFFMIGLPIVATVLLRRRWTLPWSLVLAGAATFLGSQVAHIPANSLLNLAFGLQGRTLIAQAVALGLSAGVFEEVARYISYRYWQKDARSWQEATLFGLGHGGVESILIGLLVGLTLVNMIALINVEDPAALGLPEGAMAQVENFWAMPWYFPLLAAFERVMAMVLHLGLSTLVVLCFHRNSLWPLAAAVLWHAAADAIAVYVAQSWGSVAAEGALAVVGLLSVGLLWLTHQTLQNTVLMRDGDEL